MSGGLYDPSLGGGPMDFQAGVGGPLVDPWALGQIRDFLEANPLSVRIAKAIAMVESIADEESTTSTSYTNLATVGPTIDQLSNGQYVIGYGAGIRATDTSSAGRMSIGINGAAPDEATALYCMSTNVDRASVCVFTVLKLTGGANTLLAKYKSDGAPSVNFGIRWLLAFRVGNA